MGNHIAPNPVEVEDRIRDLLVEYYANPTQNIVERTARLHLGFEYIHPFVDGNGRIGRVITNYILLREGYVPINLKFLDRTKYYEAFREYEKNRSTFIMQELFGRAITNSYHKRLAYLNGSKIMTLKEYSKKYKVSVTNLINKANRQTIKAFLEKGIWKIADK